MQELSQLIIDHLPHKKKVTNKGWIWFNAPCCVHRGHKPDTRQRGNLWFGADHNLGYHCFNCGYKWRFQRDKLSESLQNWLIWLGVDLADIQSMKLKLLQNEIQGPTASVHQSHILKKWSPVALPDQAQSLSCWAQISQPSKKFLHACEYLNARQALCWESYEYYWSPISEHDMCDRVILPFYDQGDIVGWCARWCGSPTHNKPKYFNSDIPPGYLFNQDQLKKPRKWAVVCEGPFDAIACQGVAALGSQLSELQIKTILDHGQQPIVLPDRQAQNQHMIDQALAFGWAVSFPEWDAHVKDASDACIQYGSIYTITSVLQAATTDPIAIGLKRQMFRGY